MPGPKRQAAAAMVDQATTVTSNVADRSGANWIVSLHLPAFFPVAEAAQLADVTDRILGSLLVTLHPSRIGTFRTLPTFTLTPIETAFPKKRNKFRLPASGRGEQAVSRSLPEDILEKKLKKEKKCS
jgi:hypothetical protein